VANTSHTDGNLTITVDSPEAFDLLVKIFDSLEARDMYEIYTDLTDRELKKRDDNYFSCSVPFSATSRWSFETGHLDGLLLEELKEAAGLAAHDFTLRFEYSEADPGNWCADTTAVIQHSAHESLTDLQHSVLENNSYNWTKEDVKELRYEPWQWDDEDEQPEFTALELFILETEKKTWKYQGTKEKHIHQTGTSPLTYYQTLNRMLDDERVEAREPEFVHRLRKKRDAI
jgi:hypothetical protein